MSFASHSIDILCQPQIDRICQLPTEDATSFQIRHCVGQPVACDLLYTALKQGENVVTWRSDLKHGLLVTSQTPHKEEECDTKIGMVESGFFFGEG